MKTSLAHRARKRSGLSLLEVILAIAILGGSMVIIGELVRIGSRSAEAARTATMAQILCESKMSEIAAGIAPLESQSQVPFDDFPDWLYTIETEQLPQENLMAVRVTVQPDIPTRKRPLTFSLMRWMVDPAVELQSTSEQTIQSTSSGGTSSSSQANSSGGRSP